MQHWKYLALVLALAAAFLRAEGASRNDADDVLPRLAAVLESEPLALIACRDAHTLPEKFNATTLSKMIADPSYDQGAAMIERRITDWLGVNLRALWPGIERSVSGPVVLALVPGKSGQPLRLVLLIQVPMADVGEALKQQLPKNTDGSFLAAAEIRTIAASELVAVEKLPPWAAQASWPKGDVVLWAQPVKLCAAARALEEQNQPVVEKISGEWSSLIRLIEGSGLDALGWGVGLNGESIGERLVVNLSTEDSAFKKFTSGLREKPSAWDAVMAATPGDVDGAVLFQTDFNSLGAEQAYLFQALERYLRGKRWTKLFGGKAEALDPARFKFLSDRMQGSFSLTAKAAITGEIRLIVTSAIKGSDVEEFRDELVKGLDKTGAQFEALKGARKIGGTTPLGSTFHGRGQFASPVIGLSPGWAWLCSSSIAYQELTDAFKSVRTFATRGKPRTGAGAAAKAAEPPVEVPAGIDPNNAWGTEDALRVEVNLDRVLKLGYAAWLLSTGNEAPSIAGRKIPNELLPSPQVFARSVGGLRAALSRSGTRLEYRSTCAIPGITLGLLAWMQDASDAITEGRKAAANPEPDVPSAPGVEKNPGRTPAPGTRPDPKAAPNELK